MKRVLIIIGLVLIIVAIWIIFTTNNTTKLSTDKQDTGITIDNQIDPDIENQILNGQWPFGPEASFVKFTDGKFSFPSTGKGIDSIYNKSTLSNIKAVDLNQDGKLDAVAFLSQWTEGGSGGSTELVAFINNGQQLEHVANFNYQQYSSTGRTGGGVADSLIPMPGGLVKITFDPFSPGDPKSSVDIILKLVNNRLEIVNR